MFLCLILTIYLFSRVSVLQSMFTSVDVDLRITAGETMVLLLESVYDHDEVKNSAWKKIYIWSSLVYLGFCKVWFI